MHPQLMSDLMPPLETCTDLSLSLPSHVLLDYSVMICQSTTAPAGMRKTYNLIMDGPPTTLRMLSPTIRVNIQAHRAVLYARQCFLYAEVYGHH